MKTVRIGRLWTNLLLIGNLPSEAKNAFQAGDISLSDVHADGGVKLKEDVRSQIDKCLESQLDHLEIDAGIPNPYLSMSRKAIRDARYHAEDNDISLSMRLPSSFVSASISSIQEEDRQVGVAMLRRYLDVAERFGCFYAVVQSGLHPAGKSNGRYSELSREKFKQSLKDVGIYALQKDMFLHLKSGGSGNGSQNSTQEDIRLIQDLWEEGIESKVSPDLRCVKGSSSPDRSIIEMCETIPEQLIFGVVIHPPGSIKFSNLDRESWKNIFRTLQRKGCEVVVLDQEGQDRSQMIQSSAHHKEESALFKKILDEVTSESSSNQKAETSH